MRWRQTRRRAGGWLALFALAVQLTLSFGHIHAEDFAPLAPTTLAAAQSGSAPAAPDRPGDSDHDDCPICAVMHLAGTLVLPPPPQIALPVQQNFVWLAAVERRVAPRAQRQPFQARAPPQA